MTEVDRAISCWLSTEPGRDGEPRPTLWDTVQPSGERAVALYLFDGTITITTDPAVVAEYLEDEA